MSKRNDLQEILALNDESPNQPNPLRLNIWGEDRVLGIVIENVEQMSRGGIVIPETTLTQSIPHACEVVKVSERVSDKYPMLKNIKAKYDPDSTGNFFSGPYVTYQENSADHFEWPKGQERRHWIILHATSIRGSYEPGGSVSDDPSNQ